MYRIVQVESEWVVCVGSAMLLAFDRMDAAVKTIADAEQLMGTVQAPARSHPPGFAIRMDGSIQRHSGASPVDHAAPTFVERRRTSRNSQYLELDAAE
jgi:hypothetical protein